jgi:hypothetical protein
LKEKEAFLEVLGLKKQIWKKLEVDEEEAVC